MPAGSDMARAPQHPNCAFTVSMPARICAKYLYRDLESELCHVLLHQLGQNFILKSGSSSSVDIGCVLLDGWAGFSAGRRRPRSPRTPAATEWSASLRLCKSSVLLAAVHQSAGCK